MNDARRQAILEAMRNAARSMALEGTRDPQIAGSLGINRTMVPPLLSGALGYLPPCRHLGQRIHEVWQEPAADDSAQRIRAQMAKPGVDHSDPRQRGAARAIARGLEARRTRPEPTFRTKRPRA